MENTRTSSCQYIHQYFKHWQKVPFPTDSTSYDPRIAWWLAQCSALAYANKATTATELKRVGFERVLFFDSDGTQAFLAQHPGHGGGRFAILAFRGTEQDSVDILTDINCATRLFPNENLLESISATQNDKLYAHSGFLTGLQHIWGSALPPGISELYPEAEWKGDQGVSNAICELAQDASLYITGHSLGGALATLAAYKALIYSSQKAVTALYTFGAPRVAKRSFVRAIQVELNGRFYRIVNHLDVVPRLPPRLPVVLDFRHAGRPIYFHPKRQGHLGSTPIWYDSAILLRTVLQSILCVLTLKRYTPETIQDHMIAGYIDNICQELGLDNSSCQADVTSSFPSQPLPSI